jgi:hypothetical protein
MILSMHNHLNPKPWHFEYFHNYFGISLNSQLSWKIIISNLNVKNIPSCVGPSHYQIVKVCKLKRHTCVPLWREFLQPFLHEWRRFEGLLCYINWNIVSFMTSRTFSEWHPFVLSNSINKHHTNSHGYRQCVRCLPKVFVKTSPQFLAFHKLINFPTSTIILLEYVAKYAKHVLDQGSS